MNKKPEPQLEKEDSNIVEALKKERRGNKNSAYEENTEDLDTKPVVQGQKYQIDLGSVITIEQKLWSILECFSTNNGNTSNVFEHCEEWWDLVDSNTLSVIHSIFSEDDLRRALRRSSILEFLSITMINFLSSESKNSAELHGNLKVLTFYVHQNYLQLISSVLRKLPPYNSQNIWVKALRKIIRKKTSKQILKSSF